MGHIITHVKQYSDAWKAGIRCGDELMRMNNEDILDEIDYQALSSEKLIHVLIKRDGCEREVIIHHHSGNGIGLRFGDSMALKPKPCRNNCIFCFIAQMPSGMRDTLYVKDDDWRFSLMMGNYITLTNVTDLEMERIIRRHVSPLYISVHTTNPELRVKMMKNPSACDILKKLTILKENNICFHMQIVVCPGWNDGIELERTLNDLISLRPNALSVALVPVGLTKYRNGLTFLQAFDSVTSKQLLEQIKPYQEKCLKEFGTRFVFPSDEFYCLSGERLPEEDWYEDYPQIENGVGSLRKLEEEVKDAYDCAEASQYTQQHKHFLIPTGVSASGFLTKLADKYSSKQIKLEFLPVENSFFGSTVTVTGLLTGTDILEAVLKHGTAGIDAVVLSSVVLRHEKDLFLDDMSVEYFKASLPIPVYFIENDGYAFYDMLQGNL